MAQRLLTDGGIETDLIFNRGIDLPEFAAFPLLDTEAGRAALRSYFEEYVEVAVRAAVPLLLETPTWRANPDHASGLGYDAAAVDRVNRFAVTFLAEIARTRADELVGWQVGGIIGPRGDGSVAAGGVDPDEAAAYHRPQLAAFAEAGASRATVLTLTDVGEGVGVARAAQDVGLPVVIGFTVETDGRLPDGTPLGVAIAAVDEQTGAAPLAFMVNCAHPTHITPALDGGAWQQRVGGLRVNASTMTHDEL
ncbi:homocysteine S-methyltransferase family protein, partial [Nocardioides stalactiti]|uniref:homocysteine S-methyltransferase family protein n=1 Tax=Nocardioides stalactiti TaxID=2755356 RepID=UPI001600604F